MIVHSGVEGADSAGRALAIGSFDGVHLGHRRVVARTIEVAREQGLRAAVVTFHPHPISVLRPELAPHQLSTLERKTALLDELGLDELIVLRFDLALSELSAAAFAAQVLAEGLGARHVVVGQNFRYGHRAQGTAETLRASGEVLGFAVEPAPLLEIGGAPVSSSRIRDLLTAGEIGGAAALLGRDPWIEGAVVHGDGRGRGLGFPTANVEPAPRSALPSLGVYAGRAWLPGGGTRPAAISVGYNPTFSDERERVRIEAYLLDFEGDLYGSAIRLDLVERLRGEERFGSVDDLIAQIGRDVDAVRSVVAER